MIGTGAVVGYTTTLQRILFTQLPLDPQFPWSLFGVVVVVGLATLSPLTPGAF